LNTNYSSENKENISNENFKISINDNDLNQEFQKNQNKSLNFSYDRFSKNMNANSKTVIENRKINYIIKKVKNIVYSNKNIITNFDSFQTHNKNVIQKDTNCLRISKKVNKINSFHSLGIYYFYDNNILNKTYYDIFFRKIKITDDNYIDDIFFNDVTDLINYKQIIIDENIKKQKVFAKIAHEFKTPLNSVIAITSDIKDSDELLSNFTSNKLDVIHNLSNYLILLVSDIIQYATLNDISDLNLNLTALDLNEILSFSFQILNSLLTLNNRKNENISSELRADKIIEFLNIESDEIRVKQILLNFISNSVKFTNTGKITIKAKKKTLNEIDFLKISVKDTGIGIKENDKESLFKECHVIEDGRLLNKLNNSFGSGLGLSTCKVICKKLDINLTLKSEYSKGSTFSIFIPINNHNKNNSIIDLINENIINTSSSKYKLMNFSLKNNNPDYVNINSIDLKKNLLNVNNNTITKKSLFNQIENFEIDSSNNVTKIRNDIVPLNDIEGISFSRRSIYLNSSSKLISDNNIIFNNSNSSISNSNTSMKIICNSYNRMNFNQNKNNSMILFTENSNCQDDINQIKNSLSKIKNINGKKEFIIYKEGNKNIEKKNVNEFSIHIL